MTTNTNTPALRTNENNNNKILEFDRNVCTKCGMCVKSCPSKAIMMKDGQPVLYKSEICINCGHCIAICPVDAIVHRNLPRELFETMNPQIPPFKSYLNLVKNRRSIRNYKNEKIPKEDLEKIIDAAHFSPTGTNARELKYIVIQDSRIMASIRNAMASSFGLIEKISRLFFIRPFIPRKLLYDLWSLMDRYREGDDAFLRGAPCLIIIYARKKNMLTEWDAGIASYNLVLAAETLGYGTVINGFHAIMSGYSRKLRKISKVPKRYKILASVCVGKPSIKYRKVAYRAPPRLDFYD